MEPALKISLMDIFMQQMVEPVTNALQLANPEFSEVGKNTLKNRIESFRESLIQDIHRISITECTTKKDVSDTIDHLLNRVEQINGAQSQEAPVSPPVLTSDIPVENTHQTSTNMRLQRKNQIHAQQEFTASKSDDDTESESPPRDIAPIEVKVSHAELEDDKFELISPPTSVTDFPEQSALKAEFSSSMSSSPDGSVKGMSHRKRAKRSLADTVQMLSTDVKKSPKEDSPPPSVHPAPHFTLPHLPHVPSAFNIQRWLGTPFANPMYLNMMFQQPKASEEQIAALMKMSMTASNFLKTIDSRQVQKPTEPISHFSESDDIKIDVDSDEGEVEVSPSPSHGDLTETESSASSYLAASSPSSGDCDSGMDKPFVCIHNNCGKRFANKFLLKKHMFIHTGLRPHTCPHCHKKFNRKDNLLRHKKTHLPTGAHIGQILPKVAFPGFPQLPSLHNLTLPPTFNHFHHTLKLSLDAAGPAVRSLS